MNSPVEESHVPFDPPPDLSGSIGIVGELLRQLAHERNEYFQVNNEMRKDRRRETRWRWIVRTTVIILSLGIPVGYYFGVAKVLSQASVPEEDIVGVVRITGEISSESLASADKIVPLLRKAFALKNVKAIVLAVDSPGGAPVEAERVIDAIRTFKKDHPKPVYAVIGNMGASAAYMISMHTDKIYAANFSMVGSIGAVMRGWDFHQVIQKFDVKQRVYASGKLKGMMDMFEPMEPDAENYARELINQVGKVFADDFRSSRGSHLKEGIDYTSGAVWRGATAKDIGLVDELGTIDTVIHANWGLKTHDFGPSNVPKIPFFSEVFSSAVKEGVRAFLELSGLRLN